MKKGIVEIFLEKIQGFFGGQKATPEIAEIQAVSVSLAEELRTKIAQGATFLYRFEVSEVSTLPVGMICSSHAATDNETGYVTLAKGNPQAASSGQTGGYSIHLPDQVEAAASGHHIAVSVIARASGGDQSRFAVAYSTNEVGNSGWCWFNAGAEWSIHTMEYDVPVMKEGRGDFVGILSASEDNPGTEFCYLAIAIS